MLFLSCFFSPVCRPYSFYLSGLVTSIISVVAITRELAYETSLKNLSTQIDSITIQGNDSAADFSSIKACSGSSLVHSRTRIFSQRYNTHTHTQ